MFRFSLPAIEETDPFLSSDGELDDKDLSGVTTAVSFHISDELLLLRLRVIIGAPFVVAVDMLSIGGNWSRWER